MPTATGTLKGRTLRRRWNAGSHVGRAEVVQAVLAPLSGVGIFIVDTFTPLGSAVAVLYAIVIMLAGGVARGWELGRVAYLCCLMTVTSYLLVHGLSGSGSPLLRLLVSLSAILITTGLVLRNQRSNESLRSQAALLDLSQDAIFTRSLHEDRITSWNRGAQELYGWSADEACGAIPHELLKTKETADVPTLIAQLLRTGRWEGELTHRRRNGAEVVVASRWAVRRDEYDRPIEILESNTDITLRKQADAEIRHSEARYRAIFEGARVGIWSGDYTRVRARLDGLAAEGVTDLAARARADPNFVPELFDLITDIEVNDALVRMAGARDPAHLIERLAEMLTPEAMGPLAGLLEALLARDVAYERETAFRTLAGEPLPTWMSVAFEPRCRDRDRLLITLTDLRARRAAEEALAKTQADLAHANRLATFGEFTATIAHEVNQPLAAISTNGEAALRWLARPEPDFDEARKALERIIRDGRRASEIVAGIRGMMKKGEPDFRRLDVPQLLEQAILLVQRELQARGVRLIIRVAAGLPPVLGDGVQLQQVLINLLINGAQAMAASEGPRLLEVSAQATDDGQVLVRVRDNGVGIPEENMARLFGAFFTTKPDGMGIGLAICRTTIEAHGGRIWAEPPQGPGALIAFSLPAALELVA